jgi:thioredoxin reductase (NADPH)
MAKPVLFVVDDDEDTLQLIARDLERNYGRQYRVLTTRTGRDALRTLRRLKGRNEPAALVLADLRLTDMTGVEFLREAHNLFPDAKRVLLATFRDTENAVKAIEESRIDDFLIKPCQPPEQNLYPVVNDLLADWWSRSRPSVGGLRVVGCRFSPKAHQTRDFLVRNCVPFEWVDIEQDEEARRLLGETQDEHSRLPVVFFPDGSRLVQPTNAEIAKKIGLKMRPEGAFYDLVIVGGGPSGLAAAVYGASEGLRTVMVERHAPGGQAGLSALIEN